LIGAIWYLRLRSRFIVSWVVIESWRLGLALRKSCLLPRYLTEKACCALF